MLAVRGKLDNRQAIIEIGVRRFSVDHENAFSSISIASYRALLDTGAQRTCLTHRTIAAEHLTRIGKRFIKNVHSENVHSTFLVQLGFWCENCEQRSPQESARSYYGLSHPVEVINIADNDRFDAIIGMDVLDSFNFRFGKTGEFEIDLA